MACSYIMLSALAKHNWGTMDKQYHISVLLEETINASTTKPGGTYIDVTLVVEGHTQALLEKILKQKVIGLDWDKNVIYRKEFLYMVIVYNWWGSFTHLYKILKT